MVMPFGVHSNPSLIGSVSQRRSCRTVGYMHTLKTSENSPFGRMTTSTSASRVKVALLHSKTVISFDCVPNSFGACFVSRGGPLGNSG